MRDFCGGDLEGEILKRVGVRLAGEGNENEEGRCFENEAKLTRGERRRHLSIQPIVLAFVAAWMVSPCAPSGGRSFQR